jgi:aryl-alcohol dehydrogenase-like predicted oxidoreductase
MQQSRMATLAVSWVLSNPAITAPIIGAGRPGQLADSLAAAERGPLPADPKSRLGDMTHAWRAVDEDQ